MEFNYTIDLNKLKPYSFNILLNESIKEKPKPVYFEGIACQPIEDNLVIEDCEKLSLKLSTFDYTLVGGNFDMVNTQTLAKTTINYSVEGKQPKSNFNDKKHCFLNSGVCITSQIALDVKKELDYYFSQKIDFRSLSATQSLVEVVSKVITQQHPTLSLNIYQNLIYLDGFKFDNSKTYIIRELCEVLVVVYMEMFSRNMFDFIESKTSDNFKPKIIL